MKTRIFFHALFVLVMTCPVMGQVKKQLTEADYKLWSTMELKQLSEKGSWVSYSLQYEGGMDTLFVKHTKTLKTYAFAGGTEGKFATDNCFVFRGKDGDLMVQHLKNGTRQTYSDISKYTIAMDGQLLILLKSNGATPGDLVIVSIDGTEVIKLPKVSLYSLNPESTMLICDSERKMHLLDLKKLNSIQLLDASERSYSSFVWQRNGESIAYIAEDSLGILGCYRLKERKLYTFDRSKFSEFPKDADIYNASGTELSVSDDGKKVFFGINPKQAEKEATGVQLWNTADKVLYPNKSLIGDWLGMPKLAVWFPEVQKFRMVTDNQFPCQIPIPGQEYALVYNPLDNEPQFDSDAPRNYYLQNIRTGQQQLLVANHSADGNKIVISNAGNYVAYYKECNWWVYDISSGQHKELTSKTGSTFINEKYDRSGEKSVPGIMGWTANEKELLVYDTYDIWLLKTAGSSAVRLTNGREKGIVFRLVSKSPYGATDSASNGVLDLDNGLLLQAVSNSKSGYFTWDTSNGLRQIIFENNRIGSIKLSSNGTYIYVREHSHLSPQLVFQFRNNKPKVLYQSNPQQKNYAWGFSRLISYENSKGQLLNGALFYPAGYDADKSYPIVVHIYERLSDYYNQYVNPTLLNAEGFNISNLTTQGYFVLLPDIVYKEGEPGQSAVDCVGSAVREVLAHESVDPKRVGIFGHSFGGYETNFIITQGNIFAAAISGAGVSDIVSSYLSVGGGNMKSDGWRYEFGQFRIGTSLFDDYQKYLQNSPITFASQIETPVLLWCGEADSAINYTQSLEFHMALRRLQKPNILLIYERGGHSIMRAEDQIDLTHRMQDWWDYYLKGGVKQEWLTADKI